MVRDFEDCRRYLKRAMEAYEEQLGPDNEKVLNATYGLILVTRMSGGELIDKLRALVERMVGALGKENVVTLEALNQFGGMLRNNGEYEEARKVLDICLAGQERVLGENHKDTVATVNNLGAVYQALKDYQKALDYFERALKGGEKTLGKTHPFTLSTVMNIAIVYEDGFKDLAKSEEYKRKALDGYEAQLGKEHESTKNSAMNLAICFAKAGEKLKLKNIIEKYPHIIVDQPAFKNWL